LLNRQSTLARKSQSSSGDDIRAILQDEFSNLTNEINRIANSTSFNGVKILNGNLDTKSSLNSDVRLNDITASLNIGTSALAGSGSVAFSRGTNALDTANYINAAALDSVIDAINSGIDTTELVGAGTGNAFTAGIVLGSITFNTSAAVDLTATKTITLYAGGNAGAANAQITLTLKNNEFFLAAGLGDFESRLTNDLSGVVLNQKKLGGISADTSAIGTELLTAGTNFQVTVAAGSKGDNFLVGDLSTIQLSGRFISATSADISAVINGKVYSASAYNYSNAAVTTLSLANAETGTTITLTRDATKVSANDSSSQAALDLTLAKLKGDLDGIKVYQTRQIASGSLDQFKPKAFDNTILGGLDGFSLKLTSSSFSLALDDNGVALNTTPTFEGFKVTAEDTSKGLDGAIQVTIGGEVFRTAIGTFNGKNTNLKTAFTLNNGTSEITLINERDANERFTIDLFRAKSSGINIDTEAAATTLENALNLAFNTTRESKISFQVGLDNSDNIGITVGRVTTDQIYKNADGQARNLDISTNAGAQEAVDVLTLAIKKVDSITGKVAAAYTRFQKVEENIRTGIQNNNAAASPLLDTDFTSAASELAAQQVLEQAGLSALSKNLQGLTNVLQLLR
jgi:flagellin